MVGFVCTNETTAAQAFFRRLAGQA